MLNLIGNGVTVLGIIVALIFFVVFMLVWFLVIKHAVREGIYDALVRFQKYKDILEGKITISDDDED